MVSKEMRVAAYWGKARVIQMRNRMASRGAAISEESFRFVFFQIWG